MSRNPLGIENELQLLKSKGVFVAKAHFATASASLLNVLCLQLSSQLAYANIFPIAMMHSSLLETWSVESLSPPSYHHSSTRNCSICFSWRFQKL